MPEVEVWLMRHGEAQDPDRSSSDEQRALTPRGQQQAAALGRFLAERAEPPEIVLHSPLRRARETAEALAQAFHGIEVREEPALAPGLRGERLLDTLQREGWTRAACVGHQPDISQCVAEWTAARTQFAPGMLAIIRFGDSAARQGVLRGLFDPGLFQDR